ncbi:MAG: matrixin family metalloprotease [bacterium]
MTIRPRLELVLAVLLGGLAAFVINSSLRDSDERALRHASAALARDTTVVIAGQLQGTVKRQLVPARKAQGTPPDDMRRQVHNLAFGTYVDDILAQQDSALYRWPERLTDAVRVYVEPSSAIAGFDVHYPQMARDVFAEWSEAGFPLRFTFIADSTTADLTIRWRERFPAEEGQRIGVTERTQTGAFLIAKVGVWVANHDSSGRALSPTIVDGILRHEIGHALGLNHANDPTSVMYRESATQTISSSDRATLRLLYRVPPGSLKD